MGFLGSLLSGFFQSILRIFLGGLFNQTITQADDEAQHKLDEANLQAQSASDANKVEIQVVKDQEKVKDHYATDVPNPNDPFNNGDWNRGSD